MTRYQGEDIRFDLDIAQANSTDIQDWSEFSSVVVYLYTHTSRIAKFRSGTTGSTALVLSADKKTYTGILLASDTKTMQGALYMDLYVTTNTGGYKSIKQITTGIEILYTPIKQEV